MSDDAGGQRRFQGPAARMLEDDVASNAVGIQLLELGDGAATVTMTLRPDMVNGHAIGHGGYVFLLADTAFACACNTHGPVTVASGADINFLRPVHAGDRLVAHAKQRISYGRNGIYDVTVSRGNDVIAEFRGRSRTSKREHPNADRRNPADAPSARGEPMPRPRRCVTATPEAGGT